MRIEKKNRSNIVQEDRRADILAAAVEHFRLYGYDRTTIADVARAVGYSAAYVYKFFESKQAIGEAICQDCLGGIDGGLAAISVSGSSPGSKIVSIFQLLASYAEGLVSQDCRLKDMVVAAHDGGWKSFEAHDARLREIVAETIEEGRRCGEFERVTPVEETVAAVFWIMEPFRNPGTWSERAGCLVDQASALSRLVLRSLTAR